MIRYNTQCNNGHTFEGWYPSIAEYERQEAAHEIACPFCGSTTITRAPMAPALGAGVKAAGGSELQHTGGPHCPACAAAARKAIEGKRKVPDIKKQVRLHPDERDVWGYGTDADLDELNREGHNMLKLPMLPEDRN